MKYTFAIAVFSYYESDKDQSVKDNKFKWGVFFDLF